MFLYVAARVPKISASTAIYQNVIYTYLYVNV